MTVTSPAPSPFAPPTHGAADAVSRDGDARHQARSFETMERTALRAFVAIGVVVALAPAIPAAVRSVTLLAALMVWIATVAALVVSAVRAPSPRSPGTRGLLVVGACGATVAVASAVQLELIRWLERRPALTWYIDWRWALGQARAIARFGGVDRALDYAGAPIDYHVGPAWFAGAAERLLGGGAEFVLFGLVPLLCTLSLFHACVALLASFGVPRRVGLAAAALAITLPVAQQAFFNAAWAMPEGLLDPRVWSYLVPGQMPNSMFALPLGVAAIALAVRPRAGRGDLLLGAVGLAAVVQVKPQYFAGFGLALGAIAVVRAVRRRDAPRSVSLLVVAAGSLALALLSLLTLPGHVGVMDVPRPGVMAGQTYFEAFRISTFVAAAGTLAIVALRRSRHPASATVARLPALLACMAVLLLGLEAVLRRYDFLLQPRYVARAEALGLAKSLTPWVMENDLAFAALPLRLFLLLGGFAALAVLVSTFGRGLRVAAAAAGVAVTAMPVVLMAAGATTPGEWFAVAEDADLRAVLAQVPRGRELLIASDLADPAQDYRRPLRAALLTAYAGHQFLLSNLRYVHFTRADAVERLDALRTFYGAPWSPWHGVWMERTGVTHVLVHSRCVPAWRDAVPPELRPIARRGAWRAYAVRPLAPHRGPLPGAPAWTDLVPRFGVGDCLHGGTR
jgi:hypothetical protein